MSDYLISAILSQRKSLFNGLDSVPSISISCDIFVDALNANLESRASV
jgi:hypothetical protein